MLPAKITSTWRHFIRQAWTKKINISGDQSSLRETLLHILKARDNVWVSNSLFPYRFCHCFQCVMGKENVICSLYSHFCFKESHDCSFYWDGAVVWRAYQFISPLPHRSNTVNRPLFDIPFSKLQVAYRTAIAGCQNAEGLTFECTGYYLYAYFL